MRTLTTSKSNAPERRANSTPAKITPRTINFEVSVLLTFFYFLINERGLHMGNPCACFKPLKDQPAKASKKTPTYTQEGLDRLFANCETEFEKSIFATLLLTGRREQELYSLSWPDVNLNTETIKVTDKPNEGFSPKDYEERVIPVPPYLIILLKELSPAPMSGFSPTPKGGA